MGEKGNKISMYGNRPFENALGDRIRKAREAKGETQLEMANALGLAQRASIDQWESGTRFIKAGQLAEIAQHLGVSADYLLGVTEAATTDRDHRFACDYTGLSQGAVDKLKEMRECGDGVLGIISKLLSSYDMYKALLEIRAAQTIHGTCNDGRGYEREMVSLIQLMQMQDDDGAEDDGGITVAKETYRDFLMQDACKLFGSAIDEIVKG